MDTGGLAQPFEMALGKAGEHLAKTQKEKWV